MNELPFPLHNAFGSPCQNPTRKSANQVLGRTPIDERCTKPSVVVFFASCTVGAPADVVVFIFGEWLASKDIPFTMSRYDSGRFGDLRVYDKNNRDQNVIHLFATLFSFRKSAQLSTKRRQGCACGTL